MTKNEKDGYLGNNSVKRDGVIQGWSEETIQEYIKCMQDPAYFARTYCKIISLDKGLVTLNSILIRKRCLITLTTIDSLSFLLVVSPVSLSLLWHIFYGMQCFIQKRQLRS